MHQCMSKQSVINNEHGRQIRIHNWNLSSGNAHQNLQLAHASATCTYACMQMYFAHVHALKPIVTTTILNYMSCLLSNRKSIQGREGDSCHSDRLTLSRVNTCRNAKPDAYTCTITHLFHKNAITMDSNLSAGWGWMLRAEWKDDASRMRFDIVTGLPSE